jgi:uncharacterized membrane protein YecN with MAPEG domain
MNFSINLQPLPATVLYGSLSILVTLLLALNVSLHRMQHHVAAGDAPTDPLHRKIRAHGNSVEYLAVSIFLLAFLELQRAPELWLHVCGGVLVVTRVIHSMGMLARSRLTMLTATVSYTVSFAMVVWALVLRLR